MCDEVTCDESWSLEVEANIALDNMKYQGKLPEQLYVYANVTDKLPKEDIVDTNKMYTSKLLQGGSLITKLNLNKYVPSKEYQYLDDFFWNNNLLDNSVMTIIDHDLLDYLKANYHVILVNATADLAKHYANQIYKLEKAIDFDKYQETVMNLRENILQNWSQCLLFVNKDNETYQFACPSSFLAYPKILQSRMGDININAYANIPIIEATVEQVKNILAPMPFAKFHDCYFSYMRENQLLMAPDDTFTNTVADVSDPEIDHQILALLRHLERKTKYKQTGNKQRDWLADIAENQIDTLELNIAAYLKPFLSVKVDDNFRFKYSLPKELAFWEKQMNCLKDPSLHNIQEMSSWISGSKLIIETIQTLMGVNLVEYLSSPDFTDKAKVTSETYNAQVESVALSTNKIKKPIKPLVKSQKMFKIIKGISAKKPNIYVCGKKLIVLNGHNKVEKGWAI